MNAQTRYFTLAGAAGALECALDLPDPARFGAPRGIALVGHPHPLYGGTMDNKVTQTLVRAFVALGCACARMNFRGVGRSEGEHDEGRGETDDMALLAEHMRREYPGLPLALSGFSFGTFVQAQLQQRLAAAGVPAVQLVLVGSAAGKWDMPEVPANTLLIHGEQDETIPLSDVLDWARPQDIPVLVIPGADHFFHRRLHHIKDLATRLVTF
mgnify:CR=1 FL=1